MPRSQSGGEVLAAGPLDDPRPFETIQVRLPFMAAVAEFDQPLVRAKILSELSEDPAFRLDLFTRDPNKAAQVFQTAAKAASVDLIVESVAADRIRKKIPTAWAVYSDSLTPVDIANLLGHLAVVARADQTTPFGTGHLIPAQAAEQRELRDLLGVDLGLGKRAKPDAATKPISAGTADQVASAFAKPPSASDRAAILLPFLPPHVRINPVASRDVKAFLDRRGRRPHDAVPLLVVIRPAG